MTTTTDTPLWNTPKAQTLLEEWKDAHINVKRMSWTDYFILQAYLVSTRSLDSRTQVGAIITSPEKDVLSTGYNSFIRNIDDSVLANSGDAKYDFMLHAEHNAILACARHGKSCKGSHLYINTKPCISCLQFAYQAGVFKLYYLDYNLPNMCHAQETKFDILVALMRDNMEVIKLKPSEILLKKIATIQNLRV